MDSTSERRQCIEVLLRTITINNKLNTWLVCTSIAKNFGGDRTVSLLHASSSASPVSRTQRIRPRSSRNTSTALTIRWWRWWRWWQWWRSAALLLGGGHDLDVCSSTSTTHPSESVTSSAAGFGVGGDDGPCRHDFGDSPCMPDFGDGPATSTNARQSGNGWMIGYRLLKPCRRRTKPSENVVPPRQHLWPPSPAGMTSTATAPPSIICSRLMVFGVAAADQHRALRLAAAASLRFWPVSDAAGGHRAARLPVLMSHLTCERVAGRHVAPVLAARPDRGHMAAATSVETMTHRAADRIDEWWLRRRCTRCVRVYSATCACPSVV